MELQDFYNNREERSKFVVKNFEQYLGKKVLDVGCWEKDLKKCLKPDIEYVGIDISGCPDIKIDLEKEEVPFEDNSFNTVICTDVLEHLDNFHAIFSKLLSLSNNYVLVSLPNNWIMMRGALSKKVNAFKFYGLPFQKPVDRHKWFFSYEEAKAFLIGKSSELNYKVVTLEPYFSKPSSIGGLLRGVSRFILGDFVYNNLFSTAVWAVLQKNK